jgi:chromosome segregation ATPase
MLMPTRKRPLKRPSKKTNMASRRELRKAPSTWILDGEITNRELQDLVAARGLRLVPRNDITEIEQLGKRLAHFETEMRAAADASKDSHKALTALGAQLLPLFTDLRAELGQHRGCITSLEQDRTAHAKRLDDHDTKIGALAGQVAAIEQHVFSKKGT